MGIIVKIEVKNTPSATKIWTSFEKIAFRFALIFFFFLIIPIEKSWYADLFDSKSLYEILASIAGYRPDFAKVTTESGRWGLASYSSWGLSFLIGVLGAAIWTILVRNSKPRNYNALYYWLRVVVRYRIAIGLIAFGFIKFFPMQMPFPSVSNLNTDIGDYAPFKLYWQIVGVSYKYQIFIGFLEIAAGSLLFFRSTTALGAIINAGVLFNISHANLGYDGAVHVYSSYFVLLSLFLLLQYLPNIWLLFFEKKTITPNYYVPHFYTGKRQYLYIGFKVLFIALFLFFHGYNRYDRFYNQGILKEPVAPGLSGAKGYYNVTSFVLNGDTIPYSPGNHLRWQDVAFERYSTLVYKVNKPVSIALGNGGPTKGDLLKNYEFTGRSGGKTYLYYEIDSTDHALYLVDKNQDFSKDLSKTFDKENLVGLKEIYRTSLRDSIHILKWNYSRPSTDRIIIEGRDANSDSIHVVLDRIKQTYLINNEWYMQNHKYRYK